MMTISYRGLGSFVRGKTFGKSLTSLCVVSCDEREMIGFLRKSGAQ